jgi:hypothetical protein
MECLLSFGFSLGATSIKAENEVITAVIYVQRNGAECSFCVAIILWAEYPLWEYYGHRREVKGCALYPQKRTHALQQSAAGMG